MKLLLRFHEHFVVKVGKSSHFLDHHFPWEGGRRFTSCLEIYGASVVYSLESTPLRAPPTLGGGCHVAEANEFRRTSACGAARPAYGLRARPRQVACAAECVCVACLSGHSSPETSSSQQMHKCPIPLAFSYL